MNDAPQTQRRILFVDDEQVFLNDIKELFQLWSHGNWEVHLANTTIRALELLQEHPVDLVVVDLQMPVVDGLQFVDLLNRKYPGLRKVVMTGFPGQHTRESSRQKGVELYLEKPHTREHFETVFATLNELASLKPPDGFVGVVRQAGLQDILQMECLARNSSLLEISTGAGRGRIYIDKGNIVHAEIGRVTGVSAFNALLCLRGGEFNLKPFAAPAKQTIEGQWEFLVMEAARMRDELSEAATTAEDPNAASLPAGIIPLPTQEAPAAVPTHVDEFVVCSGRGEVLYEWQSKDIDRRMRLFQLTKQKAGVLSQLMPLGRFERVEALGSEGRTLILIGPDRKLFLRSHPEPVEQIPTRLAP